LRRGEPVDLLILVGSALDALVRSGDAQAASRVDLAPVGIGMAVRQGAPRPDIATVEALRQTLLQADSVAYSDSASGVYLSTVLFPRLGIAEQMKSRSRMIPGERRSARWWRAAMPGSAFSRSANSSRCMASTSSVRCPRGRRG
jgi:molybdate transport system substrate-binding protein